MRCPNGTQGAIDELALSEEFDVILKQEVTSCGLVKRDIMHCVHTAYHEYSGAAHGNIEPNFLIR